MMMVQTTAVILVLAAPLVLSQDCAPLDHKCHERKKARSWHLGADRVNPSGTVVHGHASFPVHKSPSANTQGTVHGSHVFGGPHDGAQTVGGALDYQHNNGLHGGVDVTHTRGQGNTVSATVGGSTKLGPGTLTVGGTASQHPGSSHVQGQIGATYTVPLP